MSRRRRRACAVVGEFGLEVARVTHTESSSPSASRRWRRPPGRHGPGLFGRLRTRGGPRPADPTGRHRAVRGVVRAGPVPDGCATSTGPRSASWPPTRAGPRAADAPADGLRSGATIDERAGLLQGGPVELVDPGFETTSGRRPAAGAAAPRHRNGRGTPPMVERPGRTPLGVAALKLGRLGRSTAEARPRGAGVRSVRCA